MSEANSGATIQFLQRQYRGESLGLSMHAYALLVLNPLCRFQRHGLKFT